MFSKRMKSGIAAGALMAMLSTGAAGLVASTSFAADTPANTITITAPTAGTNLKPPTVNGRNFTAYKLANYADVVVKDGTITSYNLSNATGIDNADLMTAIKAAVITDGAVETTFADVVTLGSGGGITFKGAAENLSPMQFVGKYFYGSGADIYGNDHADKPEMRQFADALIPLISKAAKTTATGADNKVVINTSADGLGEGVYLIVETNPTVDDELVSRAMVTGTAHTDNGTTIDTVTNGDQVYQLGSIVLKADKVMMDKETEGDDQLITTGSVRTFKITTNVPNYTTDYQNWTNPTFYIVDNPGSNVNPLNAENKINNLVVKAGDKTLVEGTDYTVDTTNANSTDTNDFRITLTDPGKAEIQGATITVTYDGTIMNLDEAVTVNDATVTFSNDPYTEDSVDTIDDHEYLYDVELPLNKIAFNDLSNKLSGAQFEVKNGADNIVKFSQGTEGGKDVFTVNPQGTVNRVTAGTALIRGLAANSSDPVTYTFTETKAPEGYLLGGTDGTTPVSFTVTITPSFDDKGELTQAVVKLASTGHANFIDESNNELLGADGQNVTIASLNTGDTVTTTTLGYGDINVENTKAISDFAKTGGAIMTIFWAMMGAVAAGGTAMFVVKRRRARQ